MIKESWMLLFLHAYMFPLAIFTYQYHTLLVIFQPLFDGNFESSEQVTCQFHQAGISPRNRQWKQVFILYIRHSIISHDDVFCFWIAWLSPSLLVNLGIHTPAWFSFWHLSHLFQQFSSQKLNEHKSKITFIISVENECGYYLIWCTFNTQREHIPCVNIRFDCRYLN